MFHIRPSPLTCVMAQMFKKMIILWRSILLHCIGLNGMAELEYSLVEID